MPAYPRLLFAAAQPDICSTELTCAFLQAAADRGLLPTAFQCGAGCGSSALHQQIPGVKSRCLDHFLTTEETMQSLLYADASNSQLAVLEGGSGFFDGAAGSDLSSAWDIAGITRTPVVLLLRPQESALTLSAQVQGLLHFRPKSGIQALLLYSCCAAQYQVLATVLERETGLPCAGYLPKAEGSTSQDRIQVLVQQLERTANMTLLLQIAQSAEPLSPALLPSQPVTQQAPRIAVAQDDAFCCRFAENLELLEHLGAVLIPFSPLADSVLPPCEALYLGGTLPEQYADALSRNISMRESIRRVVLDGLPTLAEDGGFLYLGQSIENRSGTSRAMCGVLPGRSFRGKRPQGGCTRLTVWQDNFLCSKGTHLRVFTAPGQDTDARGADLLFHTENGSQWACGFAHGSVFASFARLYFLSEPVLAVNFVQAAAKRIRR